MRRSSLGARTLDHRLPKGSRRHGASDDSRPCCRSLDRHCPPDARHGHGRRHPARLVRVLRRPVGADDGGDDAARRGPGRLESRARQRSGARRAAVCRVIPRRLDTRRRPGVRGVPSTRHCRRRRAGDRGWCLRAHAAQAALSPVLPRERGVGIRVRALLRRLEYRTDGDAGSARGHEHHLDARDRRHGARPEGPARETRDRCAGRPGDHRTGNADRRRARVGSRTHATDVNRKETEVKLPKVVSQDDWTAARKRLLAKEKEFSRQRDALSAERRKLPMVAVEKEYMFEGPEGRRTLADLFGKKSQLIIYHFMFGLPPEWEEEGCPACSYVVDNLSGGLLHLGARDTAFAAISRAPFAKIKSFKQRMGWTFP